MMSCAICGKQIEEKAIFCSECRQVVDAVKEELETENTVQVHSKATLPSGQQLISEDRYCTYCGAKVRKEAEICVKCGCRLQKGPTSSVSINGKGLQTTAKVFLCIDLALLAFYFFVMQMIGFVSMGNILLLLPLLWKIPMTMFYFYNTKTSRPISTGFKVCTLLFVNMIVGILMLCDTSTNINQNN